MWASLAANEAKNVEEVSSRKWASPSQSITLYCITCFLKKHLADFSRTFLYEELPNAIGCANNPDSSKYAQL